MSNIFSIIQTNFIEQEFTFTVCAKSPSLKIYHYNSQNYYFYYSIYNLKKIYYQVLHKINVKNLIGIKLYGRLLM